MTTLPSEITLGFVLGMRHAMDPAHVIAVTMIVARQSRLTVASRLGALWGMGATLTIVTVGAAIIGLRDEIATHVGLSIEFAVALLLIVLGLLTLTGLTRGISERLMPKHVHSHMDEWDDNVDVHRQAYGEDKSALQGAFAQLLDKLGVFDILRPLIIGVVHCLASTVSVTLLVLTTLSGVDHALPYLLVFGVGTVVGTMLITRAISMPFILIRFGFERLNHYLGIASGLMCLALGLFLAYQIGFGDGLFLAELSWNPH